MGNGVCEMGSIFLLRLGARVKSENRLRLIENARFARVGNGDIYT